MKNTSLNSFLNIFGWVMITLFFTRCDAGAGILSDEMLADARSGPGQVNQDTKKGFTDICNCLTANFEKQDLSDSEKTALLYMREEEKLARDVYIFLNKKWDHTTFANISEAEARHMSAVGCLIAKYGLTDPVKEDIYGQFENKELATLYDQLTTQGVISLEKALFTGATIEDLDIVDLDKYLKDGSVDNADVRAVFQNLRKGSGNHLRAFAGALQKIGTTYTPQYLDKATYDAIIASENEKGNSICTKDGTTCCKNGPKGNKHGIGNCTGNGPGKGTCFNGNPGNNKGKGKGCGN